MISYIEYDAQVDSYLLERYDVTRLEVYPCDRLEGMYEAGVSVQDAVDEIAQFAQLEV